MQVLAAAGVVGVGVGYEYGEELPAVFVEYLPDLAARVLVVAAVDEADPVPGVIQADFCRAVDIITALPGADEFIHGSDLLFDTLHH